MYLKFEVVEIPLQVEVPVFEEGVLEGLRFGLVFPPEGEDFLPEPEDLVGLVLVEAVELVVVLLCH
jgi:hypothetical protein